MPIFKKKIGKIWSNAKKMNLNPSDWNKVSFEFLTEETLQNLNFRAKNGQKFHISLFLQHLFNENLDFRRENSNILYNLGPEIETMSTSFLYNFRTKNGVLTQCVLERFPLLDFSWIGQCATFMVVELEEKYDKNTRRFSEHLCYGDFPKAPNRTSP